MKTTGFRGRALLVALVVGIGGAIGGASCGASSTANRTSVPDRCASMSCPSGSHCEAYGAGGAHCQPDPMPGARFP